MAEVSRQVQGQFAAKAPVDLVLMDWAGEKGFMFRSAAYWVWIRTISGDNLFHRH